MGSGKSTFGKTLAPLLNYTFYDTDALIEKKTGKPILQIFESEGEEKFRQYEHEVLMETSKINDAVIATGGGLPCYQNHMEWMKEEGTVVCLKMFEATILSRVLPNQAKRPLIKNLTLLELEDFIYKTLRKRAYYYHQADIVVDAIRVDAKDFAAEWLDKV